MTGRIRFLWRDKTVPDLKTVPHPNPVVYTRSWTIASPFKREKFELIESPCHETDHDLPHLKALKDLVMKK